MFLIAKLVYDNFEMICLKQNMHFFDKYENCGSKNYMFTVKFKNRKKTHYNRAHKLVSADQARNRAQ